MTIRSTALPLALALAATTLAATKKHQAPAKAAASAGTITVITGFSGYYQTPGGLLEVSPGTFAGMAVENGRAFLLTSQGTVSLLHAFPTSTLINGLLLQGANGRLYGTEFQTKNPSNFSLCLSGGIRLYPQNAPDVINLTIQLPDGDLYGAEWNYNGGNNAFIRMTTSGVTTALHAFSKDEGIPVGLPILASDGNFYGISNLGTGDPPNSTSAMVYRITPSGDAAILATYADGRHYYAPAGLTEVLLQASNGNLYGVAPVGGSNKAGAIFELPLKGPIQTLYEFTQLATGAPTFLIEGTDHNLYGATQGTTSSGFYSTLFRITLDGQFETLQVLNGLKVGNCPCWLTLGSDGKFYGTTAFGGPGVDGAAWVWDLGLPPPQPNVTGVLPTSGATGSVVTVNGKFLLGATGVSFNGTPAITFSNISANYVSVTVPSGATTGPITVKTANGSSTSAGSFTVE
jgi:hypothetical protein